MIPVTHNFAHIFTDYGHPDEDDGVSPLPGTNHAVRLMCGSNAAGVLRGHMLVKEEWDEAEKWLQEAERSGGLAQ